MFLNAASGSIGYFRKRRVDVRTGVVLALATIPGALVGPWIGERIDERTFKLAFSIFLLAMALFLFLKPERSARAARSPARGPGRVHRRFTDLDGETFDYSYNLPLALAISLFVGILSSLLGIGGGLVHVPAMIHLMGFPVHVATATSHFVLAITAAVGVLEYARRGEIAWGLAGSLGLGVVVGAQLGAALSQRMRGRRIVRLLTVAIVILAGRLLWSLR